MKLTSINLNSPPFLHLKKKERERACLLQKLKKQKQLKLSNRKTKQNKKKLGVQFVSLYE